MRRNIMKEIKIGTQIWMAENLNVSQFRNGDIIPEVKTNEEWKEAGINKQPAWCYYDNNPENGKIYGKLYNWHAVNDIRGLAPEGWHIPTDDELTTLINYLGGENVAGGKLKEIGTTHWQSPNTGATNESGFSALPGGYRYFNGSFYYIGYYGNWWSSSELSAADAWYRFLFYYYSNVFRYYYSKEYGFSVRCVKN